MTRADWAHSLPQASLNGIYQAPAERMVGLEAAAHAAGHALFRLDLAHVASKSTLLDTFAQALAFPEHFGHNWDALADCLADLAWHPAKGYVLVLEHSDAYARAHRQDWHTLVSVLESAAENWQEAQRPFRVLTDLAHPSEDIRPLP